MLNSVRSFVKVVSSFAVVATFGFAAQASAQTVLGPELLPVGPMTVVAGGASSSPGTGVACAVGSTVKSTDAYGDGCLATQISLTAPRYAVKDSAGNIFFADYTNGLIRRIDATTGIVNTVAGGATSNPSQGTPCGLNSSIDIYGDGCNSLLVKLGKPASIAFASNGDLYFADPYNYDVRKITATSGLIPTTGGIISNVAGAAPATGTATYGFIVSNSTTSINSATASNLDAPYSVAFDKNGILYVAEEYKNAVLAVNVTTSNQTVYGITLKPGEIWKVVGSAPYPATVPDSPTATPTTCPNGVNPATSSTYGCNYSSYTEGAQAGANFLDSPFAIAFDPTGNLYISDMYEKSVPSITSAGIMTTFAGVQGTAGTTLISGRVPSTTAIGNSFGVASDSLGDIYVTDAVLGAVYRIDADTKTMYVIASGLGKTSTPTTSAGAANPGISGVTADKYDNLYLADTVNNVIETFGNGTNFGILTTSTVMVHIFKGDTPKANGYTVTATGASVGNTTFTAVAGTCTMNTDGSQDCPVVLTVTPTALGPYTGSLTVTSNSGTSVTYPLTGTYAPTPVTTTKLTFVPSTTPCTGSSNYSTTTSFTFTATVSSVGGNVSGKVQFYNNGVALTDPASLVTPTNNVAVYTTTFPTTATYNITAKFLGDSYYTASTSSPAITFTVKTPTLYLTANTAMLSTVKAGQTALYSFTTTSSVYGGQISFACSNLPANATCVFSPAVLSSDACGTGGTVALSIYTKGSTAIGTSGVSGRGVWPMALMVAGLASALMIGLRRRKLGSRLSSAGMALALLIAGTGLMSCSNGLQPALPPTPAGSYTVTVTALPLSSASAPAGQSQSITFPLVVN